MIFLMLPFWRELPSMIYHSEHSKAKMDSCCPSCVRMNVIDAWGQFNHRNEGFTHFSYTMLQAAYWEQEIPNSFAMFRLPPDLELTQSDKHIMPEVLIYQTLRSIQDCFFFLFWFGLFSCLNEEKMTLDSSGNVGYRVLYVLHHARVGNHKQ